MVLSEQVKSEQGWGRPEFCTWCLLFIYSLANQARASSRNPETFGRRPVPYAVHQHKVLRHRVERNAQAEQGGHQGSSNRCCWKPDLLQSSATSIYPESPSRNRHLHISLQRTKGDPTLFSNIGDTQNKHQVAVDRVGNGSSFFFLGSLLFPWLSKPTDVFCKEPSPTAV